MIHKLFFLTVVILSLACNQSNQLTGKWIKPIKNKHSIDYMNFIDTNKLKLKDLASKYDGNQFHEFSKGENPYQKDTIILNYKIDSIDVNNGYYYTVYNNKYSERRLALVDYPYLINCGIKPKPKDRSYLYNPQLFVSNQIDSNLISNNYHYYDFVIPSDLNFGKINLFYNNQYKKSQIKSNDRQFELKHLGLLDVDDLFDPRYLVFEKYRAFVNKDKKLINIPFLHKNIYFGYNPFNEEALNQKKEYIKSILPTDSSKCLIFSNLNMGRWYFSKNFNRELNSGDIISLEYTTRELLFKEYDRQYYGE